MIERLQTILAKVLVVLGIVVISLQVGIRHGRDLQMEETREVIEALKGRVEKLQEELETYRVLIEVIGCESGGRHEGAWGDGGKSYGILQFKKATFNELSKKAGMKGLEWTDRADQLRLGKWAIENGYGRLWSCYKRRQT